MKFTDIIKIWEVSSPIEKVILGIVLLVLIYTGAISVPVLKRSKRIDVGLLLKKTTEKSQKIYLIKTAQTLYEQMSYTDVANDTIMHIMKRIFRKLCNDQREIDHYIKTIKLLEYDCRAKIEKWMRENHFTSHTDLEWVTYKEKKINLLIEFVSEELDDVFEHGFFKVDRQKLYNTHLTDLIPIAQSEWGRMFDSAREVSRTNEATIKAMENELESYYEMFA